MASPPTKIPLGPFMLECYEVADTIQAPPCGDWHLGGQIEKSVAVQARYAASPPTKRFNGSFMLEIYEKDNPIPHHDGSRSDRH